MGIPNILFFDAESRKISTHFTDGWGTPVPHFLDPEVNLTDSNVFQMGMGVGCVEDNDGIRFYTDPAELLGRLCAPDVDAIVTFNGERFDFNLLLGELDPPELQPDGSWAFGDGFKEAYMALGAKSIDLLVHVEASLGHRVSLDQITSALFDQGKQMDGAEWWPTFNNPDILKRVKATNYLLGDVSQLKKCFAVVHECGQLAYRNNMGNVIAFDMKIPNLSEVMKGRA